MLLILERDSHLQSLGHWYEEENAGSNPGGMGGEPAEMGLMRADAEMSGIECEGGGVAIASVSRWVRLA